MRPGGEAGSGDANKLVELKSLSIELAVPGFFKLIDRNTFTENFPSNPRTWLDRYSYGKAHSLTVVARNELGDVLRAEHRYSESEKLSRDTIGALEELLGETDPRATRARANYARIAEETRVLAYRSRRQGAQPEAQLRDH